MIFCLTLYELLKNDSIYGVAILYNTNDNKAKINGTLNDILFFSGVLQSQFTLLSILSKYNIK
jgi:hypothetical protein